MLFGGYITAEQLIEKVSDEKFKDLDEEERKNTLIEQKTTDSEYPEVGDRYVLFLMDSNLVPNAYDPVNDYECIFELTGAEYKRTFPSEEKTTQYSIKEVIKNNVSLNINDLQNYCMSKYAIFI